MFRRFHKIALVALIGLWMVAGVGYASAKNNGNGKGNGNTKPKKARVTWNVRKVEQKTTAGATSTLSATFTSSAALDNVSLKLSGGLAKIVTVSPATIAHVDAGQAVNVTLTITVPADAKEGRGGVVQVRANGKNVPGNLNVHVRLPGDKDDDDDKDDDNGGNKGGEKD